MATLLTITAPMKITGTIDSNPVELESAEATVKLNFEPSEGFSFDVSGDFITEAEAPTTYEIVAEQGSSGRVGQKDGAFGSVSDTNVLGSQWEGLYTVDSTDTIRFEVKGSLANDAFDTLTIDGAFSDASVVKVLDRAQATFIIDPAYSRWEWPASGGLMVAGNAYLAALD